MTLSQHVRGLRDLQDTAADIWLRRQGGLQEGFVMPYMHDAAVVDSGLWTNTIETDDTSNLDDDGNGTYLQQVSAATIGLYAGLRVFSSGKYVQFPQLRPVCLWKWALEQTTDIWFHVGFCENDLPWAQSIPAQQHAMISYSVGESDTKYHLTVRDGVTYNRLDTGIAPVAKSDADRGECHYGMIEFLADGSLVQGTILGPEFEVLSTVVTDTNTPDITQGLASFSGLSTRAAATKSLRQYGGGTINQAV